MTVSSPAGLNTSYCCNNDIRYTICQAGRAEPTDQSPGNDNNFGTTDTTQRPSSISQTDSTGRQALADQRLQEAQMGLLLFNQTRKISSLDEAEVFVRLSLEENPVNALSWQILGGILVTKAVYVADGRRQERLNEASQVLNKALAISPRNASLYQDLARVYVLLEESDPAVNTYLLGWRNCGQTYLLSEAAKLCLEIDRPKAAAEYLNLAIKNFRFRQDADPAVIEMYRQFENDELAKNYQYLAIAYYQQGNLVKAKEICLKIISGGLVPRPYFDPYLAWKCLADIYCREKNYPDCFDYYMLYLPFIGFNTEEYPGRTARLFDLGDHFLKADDYKRARHCFEEQVKIEGPYGDKTILIRSYLSLARIAVRENNIPLAAEYLKEVLMRAPEKEDRLENDPDFKAVISSPRYKDLIEKMFPRP